jgi:hypothetical protein
MLWFKAVSGLINITVNANKDIFEAAEASFDKLCRDSRRTLSGAGAIAGCHH